MALPNAKILIHQVWRRLSGARRRTSRSTPARRWRSSGASRRSSPSTPSQELEKVAQGHGARLLHDLGGSDGLRDHRQGDHAPLARSAQVGETGRNRGKRRNVARASDGNEQLLCSFCGKSQRQVKKLIAGPGVYICDECIDLCNEIIDEELTAPTALDLDNLPRPTRHLRGAERLRRLAGGGEADARRRRLQPLQARPHGPGRRRARSSCRSRTSCCSGRPVAGRRCSRRRSRASSTCRSRSPTPPR